MAADAGGRLPPRTAATANCTSARRAAYVHYTPNETISGVEFRLRARHRCRTSGGGYVIQYPVPPIDVTKFGMIYAGAQKNIGPSGLTVVIVREDLLGRARPDTPHVFDYKAIADNQSMLNTPPTFAWYMAGLVFKWLKAAGGVSEIGRRNQAKAAMLYACIDGSQLYKNSVAADARSRMNVTFTLSDPALDSEFLAEAAAAGLKGIKGHRLVGGMRASIYNAMPIAGVEKLCAFMHDFERRHA